MDGDKTDQNNTNEFMAVQIEWIVPEGSMTPFASNMVVQAVENAFKLSFFEMKLPIRLDSSQPPPDKIRADCVASVFVTPEKLPKIIEALQTQFDNYKLGKTSE